MKLLNIFKNKSDKTEVVVVDNYKELPDFKKIAIPDLKQYLVDGYDEIRKLKNEYENLNNKYEEALKYQYLYNAALITSEEFKKRDNENKIKNEELKQQVEEVSKRNLELMEIINDYKLKELELKKKEEEIQELIHDAEIRGIYKYKNQLKENIENTKGNISKSKLFEMMRKVKIRVSD